jgi:uncharacterized protein (DUF1501 family)
MRMRLNRRQFLRGASLTAVLAGTNVFTLLPRRAGAAPPLDPILVLVHLDGGNDALNTIVPLDNVGATQRSFYDFIRPELGIGTSDLAATLIGNDPVLDTALALHPQMTGMKALYDAGVLAILNGVGYADSSLSHADAGHVWFAGDPAGFAGTGWAGRYSDATFDPADTPAISFGGTVNPTLASVAANAIAVTAIDDFVLPDDPAHPDLAARSAAWAAIYAPDAGDSPLLARIRGTSAKVVEKAALFGAVQVDGWGSMLEGGASDLHADLHQVASVLRHDALNPGSESGLKIFHLTQRGYDTHAEQGGADRDHRHGARLFDLSDSLERFYQDLVTLEIQERVLVMTYSEFGRRAVQSGSGEASGSDHGAAGVQFVLGGGVVGGVYGSVPRLDMLDENGNLVVHTDLRRVYATILERFLGVDPDLFLPGGPFVPIEFLTP